MDKEIYNEQVQYQNPILCIKIWRIEYGGKASEWGRRWHYHKELELLYVERGTMEVMIENEEPCTLHAGDVLLVGSSQLHNTRKKTDEPVSYIVLQFDLQPYFDPAMMVHYRFFAELEQPLSRLNYMFRQNADVNREVGGIIMDMHGEMNDRSRGYEIAASMLMKKILLLLVRNDRQELLQEYDTEGMSVIRPVIEHVDRHLETRILLEDVSGLANMSYSYFSRYFKKVMGISFIDFVNVRRIRKAERLLLTQDSSINRVAEQVGITNMAHFYELFRRYNECSPKEYVRKMSAAIQVT
ncbi:AraC family transcriptional regulator [Paenibacillus sp. MBLB4367]|uniref:AraC family transcriptional regulator n=1 Tax=Paenibacillus sp. MBLB4367 TaxID=3384767 RepID=UPI0039080EFE